MSISVLAELATCVSALVAVILVGLSFFNTLRSLQGEREKHDQLAYSND